MEFLTRLLDGETELAGTLFWSTIIVVALWEVARPLRSLDYSVPTRWFGNIALAVINMALLPLAFGLSTLAVSVSAQNHDWGILHNTALPPMAAVIVGVLWLDLVSYGIHVFLHRIPLFWRAHLLHHSDPDLDFTTARRHHPFEVVLSYLLTVPAVVAAGAPPLSILIWGALLATLSLVQHGNVALPDGLDRVLRWIMVTPGMHRVHHSARRAETDSNYGQVFPWWDRIFRTYCARPAAGYDGMVIGLEQFREPREQHFHRLLAQPFVAKRSD
jgi:sterol desaturase/sphingolipid hydroxylase (fatty acid hydroxylase superfamily)